MHIPQRTHYAGELRAEHIGQQVTINGWINSNRDMGGLLFLDIRDRAGVVQCVVEPSAESMSLYEEGKKLSQSCLERLKEAQNKIQLLLEKDNKLEFGPLNLK